MLKGYKDYKEIPEFWISSIPDNWDNIKIKHIFKERVEKGHPNKPLLAATQNMGVVPKDVYGNRTVEAIKDLHLLKLVKVGDFVISLRSFQGGIEYAYYEGIISPAYTVMTPYNSNSHFFRYLFKSVRFVELLQNCVTGIREGQNIDYSKLRNHFIPIPSRPEQDQIVRYLDWKVSMINKYINAKKKQIELLKEQKQAIINQAVTKGLNPKAPMRDSGIEWLGKIPAHWEVRRLQTLGVAKNGITFEPKDLSDYGTLVLRSSNIKNNQLVFDDNIYVKMPIKDNLILQENDLLICSRNGSRELIGKCALIDKQTAGQTYGAFMCMFRSTYNEYIYYVFQSNILNFYIGTFTTSTINQLTNSNLYSITIPFPADKERKEVIIFLREQCLIYDNLMNKYNSELILMQEYRTRLISDVITGKLNVQSIKVPEFENIECQNNCDLDEGQSNG
jgi:type I restriction enzyme S subunit